MTSPSIVRAAVPDDKPELWRLLRLHHAENALYPLSDRKVEFYVDRVLHPELIAPDDAGPRGIIGTIGKTGALEGMVMLVLGSPWYTESIAMDDCVNFVDPEHRRSNHADALITYSKRIVDQVRKGHPDFKMLMGIVSTERTAAKVRLYSRQLEPIGAFFMYPRPPGMKGLQIKYRTS
jgi:hypothetical protein